MSKIELHIPLRETANGRLRNSDQRMADEAYLIGVDTVIYSTLQIIKQLICGAAQHYRGQLALFFRLPQHNDIAAAYVLAGQQLCKAQLIRRWGGQLDLGRTASCPATPADM